MPSMPSSQRAFSFDGADKPYFTPNDNHPQKICGLFWRRRRDSSGGTGAVPTPARGTKKPFTGWFFPATGGPFPSHPSFFYAARKRDRKCDLFFVAEKEGFEPSRQSPQPTPLAGEPLTATWVLLHGYIAGAMLNYLAEREGFEPPVPCGITGFQDQLHKPLGHLSIFKLYNYSKGFSHCQADLRRRRSGAPAAVHYHLSSSVISVFSSEKLNALVIINSTGDSVFLNSKESLTFIGVFALTCVPHSTQSSFLW